MNIHPSQLKGKVIKDCYESDKHKLTIEFTDGTKLIIPVDYFSPRVRNGISEEVILNLSLI